MQDWTGWTLYGIGWLLGWSLLWRVRALPHARTPDRPGVAVIIPARNEAEALPHLLSPLVAQMRPGDELVVVDDHSSDDTAAIAIDLVGRRGGRVVGAPVLADGWVGKPSACWHGASSTTAPVLVFLDADVRPGPTLLDGVATAVGDDPSAVTSMQPWHDAGPVGEQASVLANVVALMGCGAFTVFGRCLPSDVAFGPVLALTRRRYEEIGGHAHPDVRASLTEDIALARRAGHSQLFTARSDASFRMYPEGLGQTLAGWSRTLANGMAATRWWLGLAVAAWVWSLAGGPFVSWLAYPLSAIQVWVLARRAGRFGPATAALYPVAVLALLVVVGGATRNRLRGATTWRGRTVARPG